MSPDPEQDQRACGGDTWQHYTPHVADPIYLSHISDQRYPVLPECMMLDAMIIHGFMVYDTGPLSNKYIFFFFSACG